MEHPPSVNTLVRLHERAAAQFAVLQHPPMLFATESESEYFFRHLRASAHDVDYSRRGLLRPDSLQSVVFRLSVLTLGSYFTNCGVLVRSALILVNGGMTEQSEEKAEESTTNEGGLHHDFGNDAIPFDASRVQTEIASAQNDFALRMLPQVGEKNGNLAFSSYTVNNVFGMAATMTFDEEYAAKIAGALGLDASKLAEMHDFNSRLSEYLAKVDPNTSMLSANSVISECGVPDIPDLTRYYNPSIATYVKDGQQALNEWVSDKSGGLIKEVKIDLPHNGMPMTALSSLINFNTLWRGNISKSATREEIFTNVDGTRTLVTMMHFIKECSVYNGGDYMVLRMPCGNKGFEMLVVLPDEDKTLADILPSLTNAGLTETLSSVHAYNMDSFGSICVPRFEIETTTELTDIFNKAGLENFPIRTILNDIEIPTLLSYAINRTLFGINERGAYGVSVTTWAGLAADYNGPSPDLKPARFIANRPFAFFVREASTGSFLMAGAIRNMK